MNGLLKDGAGGAAQPARSTAALALSAALHTSIVLAALALADRSRPDSETGGVSERPAVQLLYVPPAAERRARTLPRPPAPRAPREEAPVTPAPRTPAVPPMPVVPEHDEPAGRAVAPAAPVEPAAAAQPPAAAAPSSGAEAVSEPSMIAEARRIFGRRTRGGAPSGGPAAARGLAIHLPGQSDECIRRPAPARPPGAPVRLATVSGRVYREGTRIPLAGAHLQMIGTPHVAFSDGSGRYDLQFDPALVDECRTQYVRVTAPGFRAQTLVLYLGPSAANDIPMARR